MTADRLVREATVQDVEAVVDVARASWYAAYGGFLDPAIVERGLEENFDPELVVAAVERDEIAFVVAEIGDDVVGFASAEQTWADEVELHTVYVHPDRWGEGVGSALLDRIEAWAREQDVDRIACASFSENAVGVGFLESRGFEREGDGRGEIAGDVHPEVAFEYEL